MLFSVVPQTLATWALAAVLSLTSINIRSEAPGPSSRRTDWVISELMYHPRARSDGREAEFIELHNSGLIADDLTGYRLSGEVSYAFPSNTVVAAGGYLVVAPVPADVQAVYGLTGVIGGFSERLSNNAGTLRLLNPAGAVVLEVEYNESASWPLSADGAGASLVLAQPSRGEGSASAWSGSTIVGGTPGRPESAAAVPGGAVQFSEIVPRGDSVQAAFVELYNPSLEPADLGLARLTDSPVNAGFTFPAGTQIMPHAFLVLNEAQLGFALQPAGGRLYLYGANDAQIFNAVEYVAASPGDALGRDPLNPQLWIQLSQPTPGTPNSRTANDDMVINEIQYHPITEDLGDQFVELHNRGTTTVDLAGWRFVDGIDFEFPLQSVVAPGEYLVVARNKAQLLSRNPELKPDQVVGDFAGALAFGGERIVLARPEVLVSTNVTWVVVDEVTYDDGGQWGDRSDGRGSTLELVDPESDNRLPANWAESDESSRSGWTQIQATGVLNHGTGPVNRLQLLALGPGEYLVDDVEVLNSSSANLVNNGAFDSGMNGWTAGGTLSGSTWDSTGGVSGSGALHVKAVARGDTGANRIETSILPGLAPNRTATLRARVRWLSGTPEFLLRLRGNHLEATGALSLPGQFGTPGRRNSRVTSNAPPALYQLAQEPILPRTNEPVRITIRADDPDGISNIRLEYRVDPSFSRSTVPMLDDGTGPDTLPNDGIFSALLPGQSAGSLVAFRIVATDAATPAATRTYPSVEALVRFGEQIPPGAIHTYRIWMTDAVFREWSDRPKLDNTPLPITFVLDDQRIIHGVGALYAGSPHLSPGYSTPSGNLCGYVLHFPKDEPFLGATEVVLDWPGRDATAQQEPMAYWIARELGIPFNHRRYVRLHVNGVTEASRGSIYEDAQQVNSDLMSSWFPSDAEGELYKIEQWFEFDDILNLSYIGAPRLQNYLNPDGQKKVARYRWNWLKRAVRGSASNYEQLFELIDAANPAPGPEYPSLLTALADIEEWMRVFATENIVVNFDAWGYDIGKNMYAYKPERGRWQLFMWDIDWVMTASAQVGYSPQSPLMYRGTAPFGAENRDPVVGRMYQDPTLQRAYWRAIQDAIEGPLRPEQVASRMDTMYAALVANNVTHSAGLPLTSPDEVKEWLRQRQNYLQRQLNAVTPNFEVLPPPPAVIDSNPLTLTGTAPPGIRELRVNNLIYPVTWTRVTNWSISVPLASGTNVLQVTGIDRLGQSSPALPGPLTVLHTGTNPPPILRIAPSINEWMPDNSRFLADPADSDFEDWFELCNPSDQELDLTGYSLSDDPFEPGKFQIPPQTGISPHGFLLIWADDEVAQNVPGGDLHASFRLSQSGETIVLTGPDGRVVDRIDFGAIPTDRSGGRWPDGKALQPAPLRMPTPRARNLPTNDAVPAPTILGITRTPNGGVVALRWQGTPGLRYRIQATDRLGNGKWTDIGPLIPGAEGPVESVDNAPTGDQRYYRIIGLL